ncbi:MAG TPA: HlyD family type I secretion periplasmic adaptor subunit [Gammaproteobacteria bacterium]
MRRQRRNDATDIAYMRSLSAAVIQRSPRHLMSVMIVIALAFAAGIAWAGYAELDIVVRGSGKAIPSQQLQVIQSLEGGVVSEILVAEGDLVEVSQPLVKISDVAFASSLGENRLQYLELRANIARLQAEAYGTEFKPDEQVANEAPDLLSAVKSLHESNVRQLEESLGILEEQVSQQQSELTEARAKRRQLERSLSLMQEEIELKKPLVQRGLVSRVEFLQLQQQENEIEGELEGIRLSIPRLESKIEEAKKKIVQGRLDFRNKAERELNDAVAEASRIQETQTALKDRVQRTTIRAPVKGTVTRLHVNTVGGVIQPGAPILEVVPFEDALLVQIEIDPQDVANINVGQPARLKFTAYDFAIHGSIEGTVRFLSADTVTDEDGRSYYIARIKPAKAYFGHANRPLPIRVGMTAEADIITDKRTVLQYLMKPITRGAQRAFREG